MDNNICFKQKYNCTQNILDELGNIFESTDLFKNTNIFLDNLSTINNLFQNYIHNKIIFFCVSDYNRINNFIHIQNKLKNELHIKKTKFQIVSIVSNYYSNSQSNIENNSNREYDNIKLDYNDDNIPKPISITIYFLNKNLFCNEIRFNNLVSSEFFYNIKCFPLSSVYYCLNDKMLYSIINGNYQKLNEISEITSIFDNLDGSDNSELNIIHIDEKIILNNPYIFFDIISYYLITKNNKFKEKLELIITEYQNNKNIKKKYKKVFNFDNEEYIIQINVFIGIITNYSLDKIYLDTV